MAREIVPTRDFVSLAFGDCLPQAFLWIALKKIVLCGTDREITSHSNRPGGPAGQIQETSMGRPVPMHRFKMPSQASLVGIAVLAVLAASAALIAPADELRRS